MTQSSVAFPLHWACLWAMLIGAVYFLPQAIHLWQTHAPQILLEENYDEIAYAVWASRAAGEHAGQPEPYQVITHERAPVSFANAQPLPAFALGNLARVTRLPATVIFFVGSFLFPAIIAFLFFVIVWCSGIREHWLLALSIVFSLLVLPPVLWLMQWRYVTALLSDSYPGFRLTLTYSRRCQPQFTAMIHYLAIAFSLIAIRAKTRMYRWCSGLLAGIAFGLCFYCYYFSWSLLFGWFVLGAVCIWRWHTELLRVWLTAFGVGGLIAIPYVVFLIRHFGDISASAASTQTHTFPQDPAIFITLLVCTALAGALWLESEHWMMLWVPLVLNLAAVLGAVQNVITGIYIQPYHYLHYFARPTTNLALVVLVIWACDRWLGEKTMQQTTRLAAIGMLTASVFASSIFQYARYREVDSLARAVMVAQPSLQALGRYAEAGAQVYCPQATAREAIPLYTNAISFYSLYMLLNETERTHLATQQRIAAMQWLGGMDADEFAAWLKTRPLEVYFQHLQRRIDAQSEERARALETDLRSQFASLQPTEFALLRYALLPITTKLETTRLPLYFNARQLWADDHYILFELTWK